MANEIEINPQTTLVTVPVVGGEAPPAPTPKLQPVAHPNGSDVVVVIQTGAERWETVTLQGRRRARRKHTFGELASFVRWIKRHADPDQTEIGATASDASLSVVAALTPRTVDGDAVVAKLRLHPKVEPWIRAFAGEGLGLSQLHELVRNSLDVIEGDEGELILGKLARFRAVDNESIEIGIGENGMIELAAATRATTIPERLPTRLWLLVPLWLGGGDYLPESRIEVFLGAEKIPGGIIFKPTARLDLVTFEALQRVAAKLAKDLEGFEVGIAELEHEIVPAVGLAPRWGWATSEPGSVQALVTYDADANMSGEEVSES